MQCRGGVSHWRDIAYLEAPMDRYHELRNCVAWTAHQFELPEELIYAILYVERGPINGVCSRNTNGTEDCGPAQINDVRLEELRNFNLTKEDMKKRPCHNIWALGYLVRREIDKAGGVIWTGVGNYHFHHSVNRTIHNRYIERIRKAWEGLNARVQEYCRPGGDEADGKDGNTGQDERND